MSAHSASPNGRPSTVVGIGASAGGVEALTALMGELEADLSAAVVVVMHIAPGGTSILPQILDRAGPLSARAAAQDEPLTRGHVYVAPADCHLLVEDGRLRLWAGPRENGHRPAVDPLFRSIAASYGPGGIGVVLSGTRDDGTFGLARIRERGGHALVQDPKEASYDGMPRSALAHVDTDGVLAVAALARRIAELSSSNADPVMTAASTGSSPAPGDGETRFTCPDCGGVLYRHDARSLTQFRCSVGHVYSPNSLDDEQARQVEGALWAAVRMLDDRADFLRGMAGRAIVAGHERSRQGFQLKADEAQARSDVLRELVEAHSAREAV
jgi:two-component system chemotaxis response regulator CheB